MCSNNNHIQTARLTLVPLRGAHKERFIAIAGAPEVARMTADIPHPLTLNAAQLWFRGDPNERRYAIERAGTMIGTVGYFVGASQNKQNNCGAKIAKDTEVMANEGAELGFFIAKEHWGNGYASEAARAVIAQGFAVGLDGRPLTQFTSSHFTDNPASARVLLKLGFKPTHMRQVNCEARGRHMQAQCYSLSRGDFDLSIPNSDAQGTTTSSAQGTTTPSAQGTTQPSDTRLTINQHLRDAS